MDELKLFDSEFVERLRLPLFEGLRAGFPSPAADYEHATIDFNRDFITHPESTFYARVQGDSMRDAGISAGDIIVIDRAQEPRHGDVVVGFFNREFTIKFLDTTHRQEGWIELRPANAEYKPIHVDANDEFAVWGKVIFTIKDWRGGGCMR